MSRVTEVLYPDGSRSEFTEGGGAFHEGDLAMERLRLLTARQALRINLERNGWELTRNGSYMAVMAVIAPLTGKDYLTASGRLTKKGKAQALADCEELLTLIEGNAVVLEVDDE